MSGKLESFWNRCIRTKRACINPDTGIMKHMYKEIPVPKELQDDVGWFAHYEALNSNLMLWINKKYLSLDEIQGARILDFGGSWGQLAVNFINNGARDVTVIDTSFPVEFYKQKLKYYSNLHYDVSTIEEFSSKENVSFDLIVAHTVTEHLQSMASCLSSIYKLLRPGGLFFVVHDNYYHPSGAHDNMLLQCNSKGVYGYNGPKCWETSDKCISSNEFRRSVKINMPWAWDESAEKMLTPENCENCLFYKRSQPWAHLLYQYEFNDVFTQKSFTSGQADSMLNKITPFQLRQYIIEAGFDLELWQRTFVNNIPPRVLLYEPFCLNETDLKTVNVYARCRKKLD